jgi:hypothetical protein
MESTDISTDVSFGAPRRTEESDNQIGALQSSVNERLEPQRPDGLKFN